MFKFEKVLISFFMILIFGAAPGLAQTPELRVESMTQLLDPMTVEMQRRDLNESVCALLKVVIPVSGCEFEGNVIGDVAYKVNEYWVYLSPGSKWLQIKCPGHYPLRFSFSDCGIPAVNEKSIYQLVVNSTGNFGQSAESADSPLMMPSQVKDMPLDADVSIDYNQAISVADLLRYPMGFVKVSNRSIWDVSPAMYTVAADKAEQLGIFVEFRESDLNWSGMYMKNERKPESTLTVDGMPLWQSYPIIENGNKLQGFGYMFAPFYGATVEEELSPKKIMKLLAPMLAKIKSETGFKQIKRPDYVKLMGYAYGEEGAFFHNPSTSEVISVTVSGNIALLELRKL